MTARAAIILFCTVLSACTPCHRAARLAKRAAMLCPEMVARDTVHVTMPGDTVHTPSLEYAQADVDSILAACTQLAEALATERDLYAQLFHQPPDHQEQPRTVAPVATPPWAAALMHLRGLACRYEPFSYENDRVRVYSMGGDTPGVTIEIKPVAVDAACPPAINCDEVGVSHWWRTVAIVNGIWLLAVLLFRGRARLMAVLLPLLLLPALASAQVPMEVVADRRPGERSLMITGMLTGADSAYLQVYHDEMELHADIYVHTFSITLGTYDWYMLRFTDPDGRVKRVAIHGISDDMVQFLPPIEVDFDREGDLVLVQPSARKPMWLELDTRLSRRRTR